jgi:hypothetical protein
MTAMDDARLLSRLGGLLELVEPVPPKVAAFAREAFALRELAVTPAPKKKGSAP